MGTLISIDIVLETLLVLLVAVLVAGCMTVVRCKYIAEPSTTQKGLMLSIAPLLVLALLTWCVLDIVHHWHQLELEQRNDPYAYRRDPLEELRVLDREAEAKVACVERAQKAYSPSAGGDWDPAEAKAYWRASSDCYGWKTNH